MLPVSPQTGVMLGTTANMPQPRLAHDCLLNAPGQMERLFNVRHPQGALQRRHGSAGGAVQERVDLREADALEEHGNGFAYGLDGAGPGTALGEAEELLGKGRAERILELHEGGLV